MDTAFQCPSVLAQRVPSTQYSKNSECILAGGSCLRDINVLADTGFCYCCCYRSFYGIAGQAGQEEGLHETCEFGPGSLICVPFRGCPLASLAMTAVAQIRQMPEEFQEMLRAANPAVFEDRWHQLDCPERYVDVFEMYAGSQRISSLCQKARFGMSVGYVGFNMGSRAA